MGICLTLCRNVISAGRSARGRVQPTAAASSGAAGARAMSSVEPPLAVRAGVAAVAAEEAGEQQEAQREGQQQGQRQRREKKAKPPPPPRPTHFLALQVSQHPGVAAAISTVQASLKRHSPHLKKACVEAASAHLTLGVMALNSEEERARAAAVLAALAEPLRQAALLAPVRVQLEGLSHFKNQVLYLDVSPDNGLERLMALAAATRVHFKDAGLLLQADQPFVPHVTIAKTSKLQGWGKKGHGRGGGKGHGGHAHGHGHGQGSKHERHDWKGERRDERRAKQQRLEMQAADEEALASMDWGREGEEGNGGSGNSGAADAALPAAEQPAEDGAEVASMEASASAASLPASATEPPSSSNANNDASMAAAAAAAGQEGPEANQADDDDPTGGQQQAQQAQHGSRKRQHEGEGAAGQPAHHSGGGNWRQIDAEAWAQHVAIEGGSVLLGELQLCAMQGRKPEEYYPVLCNLPLAPAAEAAAAVATPGSEGAVEQAGEAEEAQVPGAEDAATGGQGSSEDAGPATQPAAV
ncbi:A-kinase anchor 7 isoform gamma [Chlorella sorokiniana]|uniref:A-kinase anchor 7 isoform gamma n=1 Tax=Chlorella sorokiniana TaxID=3076 RepID=A0A2P6TPU5_CHLSO|nr:A-kinase anchor 7 isoform gamma [Chlorella sorokiniana]|eukprot:PRW56056.1 A-kinase anchor 7 isoform gamma [Chlorella sorokiniana]